MKPQNRRSEVDEQIDENLKRAFEDMANAPVPDRFAELLEQLKNSAPDAQNGVNTDD